jgi:hypothetical protein
MKRKFAYISIVSKTKFYLFTWTFRKAESPIVLLKLSRQSNHSLVCSLERQQLIWTEPRGKQEGDFKATSSSLHPLPHLAENRENAQMPQIKLTGSWCACARKCERNTSPHTLYL